MTLSRNLLLVAATSAVALTPTAGALAAGGYASPEPKLVKAELVTAPEIDKGTVGIVFRADHELARGANGGTLKGRVGFAHQGGSSIGTAKGAHGRACYVGYVKRSLKVGHAYQVTITIGTTEYHRTLTLKRPRHVADRGADLGC